MNKAPRKIKTVMIPIGTGDTGQTAISIARHFADEIILVGVVPIAMGESVSAGAQIARQVRKRLMSLGDDVTRYKSTVIVSSSPWQDLQAVIDGEKPDLLILEWVEGQTSVGIPLSNVLNNSVCNIAIIRSAVPLKFDHTLIAVRGGPHAELALQVVMELNPPRLDALHLALTGAVNDAPFKGIKHILQQIPEVNLRSIVTDDIARTIFDEADAYDLVILGVTASQRPGSASIGPVAEKLLRHSPASVLVLKTCRPISEAMFDESAGTQAISILVDKWFAENTFHANEFSDLYQLMAMKERQGVTISLALPALNEEKTVGKVIATLKEALMEKVPLLDEIVLIDSNSTDRTRRRDSAASHHSAAETGSRTQQLPALNEEKTVGRVITTIKEALMDRVSLLDEIILMTLILRRPDRLQKTWASPSISTSSCCQNLAPEHGKGEALWKSLLVTHGDIVAWIDTDIVNIHPHFVYGILGPLLLNREHPVRKRLLPSPAQGGQKTAGQRRRTCDRTHSPPPPQPLLPRTVRGDPAPVRGICRPPRSAGKSGLLLWVRR